MQRSPAQALRLCDLLKHAVTQALGAQAAAARGGAAASLEQSLGRTFAPLWRAGAASRQAHHQVVRQQAALPQQWRGCAGCSSRHLQAQWHGLAARRLMTTAAVDGAGPSLAQHARQALARESPSLALSRGLPDGARKQLAVWIGGCSAWVFSMVVLGGFTRLTRSGLSMTDWKFTGERPPMTQDEWAAEFAKYQASPEFRLAHSHMTVEDFKFIYFMEWAHRMWGRLLGIGFALPATYFVARGFINGPLAKRLGVVFLMGGAQGLVGWWMVRSGLKEPEEKHHVPRVSAYRLAAHLTSAFAIYATLVWTTLDLLRPQPVLARVAGQAAAAAQGAVAAAARAQAAGAVALRRRVLPLAALVGVTAVSGAFVAGLDAGHAYNTFPLMNGQLVPDEYWALPGLRNAFENTAAVQLHHRALALTTLAGVAASWAGARRLPLPAPARAALNATALLTAAQVSLGITTLLTYVPVSLGAAHQAGALALFTGVLTLMHTLRPASPSAAALAVSRLAPPVAVLATAAIAAAVTQTE